MISAVLAAAVLMMQAASAADPAATANAAKLPGSNTIAPVTVTGAGKTKPADRTEVVCHKEPVLGSLFPKEVCANRLERDQRREQDQAMVRDWLAYKPLIVH